MPDATYRPADRNLLFGVVALQMDFISRDQLIAALNGWVLEKHKPLGQVLQEQGALNDADRAALEGLVDRHLARHGGDPERSLATVRSAPQVREPLPRLNDPDLHASLAWLDTPATRARAGNGMATLDHPPPGSAGRFRVLRPHARGGVGEVFVAEDTELHREVALKQIHPGHDDDPQSRTRFLLEAEVCGRLEHPGVVPVYGLGTDADGRPYYAMRLIEGETLQEAIRTFHAGDGGREPGARRLVLRQLLTRFVAVCNAVAYAHSRGVIHRDLKPANVMLGKYGETLVVDWGLAKVVGRAEGEAAGERPPLRLSGGDGLETEAGATLGTPAYMSPEQAAGRLDLIGPATDVYGLGATLYHLLTGQPPVQGDSAGELLRKAGRSEWPAPRQVNAAVPAALQAICLRAMAPRPQDRYASAQDVAADVERWLADEPVTAYREPWQDRARRWARRHRALTASAAAAALVGLLALGTAAWWLERQAAETRRAVEAALADVGRLQARARWGEARAVLDQAGHRLGDGGPADLRTRLGRTRADLALVARLDAVRLERSALVRGKLDYAGADRGYEASFAEAGLGRMGDDPAAVAQRVAGSGVRDTLVAALDDWAMCLRKGTRQAWVLEVVRRADPDPWRDRLRDVGKLHDRAALARLAREVPQERLTPPLLVVLGSLLGPDAEGLLREGHRRYPGDFWLNVAMGNMLDEKEPAQAVAYYRAALAVRPEAAAIHFNLGNALRQQDRLADAVTAYRDSLALAPGYAPAHNNLGETLLKQGHPEEAVAELRKTVDLVPKDVRAHHNLGLALRKWGKVKEAVAAYRQALKVDAKDALVHYDLGNALRELGRPKEAMTAFRKAVALAPKDARVRTQLGEALLSEGRLKEATAELRKAVELDPKLAVAHQNLGLALRRQGRLDEAISAYRKGAELEPDNAAIHYSLGNALLEQDRLAEAEAAYRTAIALKPGYAEAHNNLGTALHDQGRLREAVAELHKAVALNPKAPQAHHNLGNALRDQGLLSEALAAFNRAIELAPRSAGPRNNLALTLQALGRYAEAEAQWRKAIELAPQYAPSHASLGRALLQQGRLEEARQATGRAAELLPPGHPLHPLVAGQLRECARLLALDAILPAIRKGQARPADLGEHFALARLCSYKGLHRDAARLYADAFAAGGKGAEALREAHLYEAALTAALAAAGKGKGAPDLDGKERVRLRGQALGWLRAEVRALAERVARGTPQERVAATKALRHMQSEPALASVREPAALAELPEAERGAWQGLWAEVSESLEKLDRGS
jgi:tetratricopeptide (TPR) repeat protein